MSEAQAALCDHYRALVRAHGQDAASTQMSAAGQRFRFHKLLEIAPLDGLEVLDLGCGTGTLYPELRSRFPAARYTGLDIVPEMLDQARLTWPDADFVCRDVLAQGLPRPTDFVLASALFNNARPDASEFLSAMLEAAWAGCRRGLAFNFISTHVTRRDDVLAYHDPAAVLRLCLERLGPRVTMQHHYERCDVSVFVMR